MNDPLPIRLARRATTRLAAPPALLEAAFPEPCPLAPRAAPLAFLATGVAAAAVAAAPLVPATPHGDFDRQASALVGDLVERLSGGPR
ncbi:MAG: hypothetical protein GC161_11990 [Planctomycetaceae bacterium]|nr:hypothetical protein [Planctomycetaceae bacterium]